MATATKRRHHGFQAGCRAGGASNRAPLAECTFVFSGLPHRLTAKPLESREQLAFRDVQLASPDVVSFDKSHRIRFQTDTALECLFRTSLSCRLVTL
jgi:hypothetical protein